MNEQAARLVEMAALAEDPHVRAVVARAMFGPPGPPMTGPQYAHHRRRAGEVIRVLAACATRPAPTQDRSTGEETVSTCTSPWFGGLTCDHLYADCPNRERGIPELARWGWDELGGGHIDPHGTDICGLCRHRHNRSEHKTAEPTLEDAP